jgi:hypothetical protein
MTSMSEAEPPLELPTGSGLYRALVVPFDEPIQPPHLDAGHRFGWIDVHFPRAEVALNVDTTAMTRSAT